MYNGHAFNYHMKCIPYIFLQYTSKYKYGILVFDTIIINDFDKYNDS